MKSLIIVPFLIGSLPLLGSVAIGYNYLKSKKDSKFLYWGGLTASAFGGWMVSNMIMNSYLDKVPISVLAGEALESCPHNMGFEDEEVSWLGEGDRVVYVTGRCPDCRAEGDGYVQIDFEEGERYIDKMAAESFNADKHRFMIACGGCGWNFTDEYIKNNTDGNIRPMYGDQCSCGGMIERYDFEPEPKPKPKGFLAKLFKKNAENWGGDPKGKLAVALQKARDKAKESKKPLKIEKLDAENYRYVKPVPISHSGGGHKYAGYYAIKGYEKPTGDGFTYRILSSPGTKDWYRVYVYDTEKMFQNKSRRLNPSGKMVGSSNPASHLIGSFPRLDDAKRALVFRMIQDEQYHHILSDGNLNWLLYGKNPGSRKWKAESFAASGSGNLTYEGGRMVSIEEVTIVDYNWHTDPDETDDVDEWDIEFDVQEKVENEMYDGDSGNGSWSYGTDSDGTNVEVYYEWNKTVEDGGEEFIKGW